MSYTRLQWRDGQAFSQRYADVYCSRDGGVQESRHVFIEANNLLQRFAQCKHFCVAETGFGAALNFLLTASLFLRQADEHAQLDYVSVEKHLLHPDDIRRCCPSTLQALCDELLQQYPPAIGGLHRLVLFGGRIRLTLFVGDVDTVPDDWMLQVDAWFLDGFSPAKNPSMWSPKVFEFIARYSHAQTSLSTYSVAGQVRRGLQQAGFEIARVPGYGCKREMLQARYQGYAAGVSPREPWYSLGDVCSGGGCGQNGNSRAVVVGAGIAGLSTAWQLIRRGWQITLVDKAGCVAAEASGNPAAVVAPKLAIDDADSNAWSIQAFYFARQQYRWLQQQSAQRFWQESGVLHSIAQGRADKLLDAAHVASSCVQRSDALPALPGRQWLWYPDGGWLRPKVLSEQLWQQCAGSTELVQVELAYIDSRDGEYALYDSAGHCFAQTRVLVLANAHAVTGLKEFDDLPVRTNRGQVSTVQMACAGLPASVMMADKYCIAMGQDTACLGASYADTASQAVSVQDNLDNMAGVKKMLPHCDLGGGKCRTRVSLRAVTPDQMPIVGPVQDREFFDTAYADLHHGRHRQHYPLARYHKGLFLNVGHGSRGFTSAMLSAEIIASLVNATMLPVPQRLIRKLLPARFQVRRLQRRR